MQGLIQGDRANRNGPPTLGTRVKIDKPQSAITNSPANYARSSGATADDDRPSHNAASVVNNQLADTQGCHLNAVWSYGRTGAQPIDAKKPPALRVANVVRYFW